MALTGIVQQASLMPIIRSNQLMEWEMYTAVFNSHLKRWVTDALHTQNSSWYSNNIDTQQTYVTDFSNTSTNHALLNVSNVLQNWESNRFSSNGTYLQGWQTFPLIDEFGSFYPVCKYC
jgi:hypothetical protein